MLFPTSYALKCGVLLGLVGALGACGGPAASKHPHNGVADVASPLAAAFHEEAGGDQAKAVDLYLNALDAAAKSPDHPQSVSVAMAALDALIGRDVAAFWPTAGSSALVDRVSPNRIGGLDSRLEKIEATAEGPFVRGLIARARLDLAERHGDANAATARRAETGCAREAALVGPVAWMNVSGATEPGILDKTAVFPGEVNGPGPFIQKLHPLKVASFGCHVPLYAESSVVGVREVAIDVDVPASGVIGVGLRTNATAVMRAGGVVALERPHTLGNRAVPRFARVEATAGTLRLVTRVGMESDFSDVEIGAWDEDGKPLKMHAPAPGAKATGSAKRATAVETSAARAPTTDNEKLAVALGLLAGGDTSHAENLLSDAVASPSASPDLLLAYARAVRSARDLPNVKSQERARSAYERVLDAFPASWEATIEHAMLAGARRGRAEAAVESLTDLATLRAKSKTSAPELLDAYEAQVAGRDAIYDRAKAAFERAKGPLAGTGLISDTDRAVNERTGAEQVALDCGPSMSNKASLACHDALMAVGDRAGAEKELERLRALGGAPQLYLSYSTRHALEVGDLGRAQKLLDQMNPGDRTLSSMYAAKGKAVANDLLKLAPTARDAPSSIPSLLRDAGDDPLREFSGAAEKAVAEPASSPLLANAATAILAHKERYDVSANGLVHFVLFDVRRVNGTTDVDTNAQAGAPMLYGRDMVRILRRRIFKKDGRIVLPDPTPRASQSHADLSQLEAGDAVEAIYEGWTLPSDNGNVTIDTPDMLPERTAVHDATIELHLPNSVKSTMWTHPLLGQAETQTQGDQRVLTWRMKDKPVRRVEAGVAKMDRNVGVSFSTATWDDVARGLRETIAALDNDTPEVSQWTRETAGTLKDKALVEKVVNASGVAVKEANGIVLSDLDLGRGGNNGMTARNILVTHEGSRTWLIVHALRELGVKVDIAVAENEPFSESASFPPHFGRFMHPLAVAHVAEGDIWIDADVAGPPLPAGKISPELRGRNALWADGKIAPLPALPGSDKERDEVDIRLTVDEKGDAKGTITVLLRGQTAQDLSEALVRIVGVERQRALRGIALGWVPFATVEKVELSSSEGSWQVAIRADLTAPSYAQQEGSKPESRTWVLPGMDPIHYVYPRPFVTTLSATYASQAARESALAINRATQYHVRRRVDLPAKASIARLPGPFDEKGPLFAAVRKISVTGASIEEDFTLDVTTGTIPQAKYEQFVSAAHHADDAFQASTRVKPPKP
jgi:hypothetical protein